MDGKTGFRSDSKKIKVTKSYKEPEIVESHDRQRPEETELIGEERGR